MLSSFITFSKTDTLDCDYPDRDTTEAESLPWFGNNNYLESFLDSIGYPSSGSRIIGTGQVRYHVPIKFWVYRSSAGVGGPTLNDLQNYIDDLNRFFNIDNNSLIGFYMKCDIGFINDDEHLFVRGLEAWDLIQAHKEKGCINVHITQDIVDANGVSYRSRFFGVDGIFVDENTYLDGNLASTLSHEVGHYFELDHTHQYFTRGRCRKEAIDRSRTWPSVMFCPFTRTPNSQFISESTSDFLRDTPADHDLTPNNSCFYVQGGQTDPWGDQYESPPAGSLSPDPTNILSYNRQRICRVTFSRLQIAVMLYSIERGKSKNNRNAWKDTRSIYDEYEMDNFPEAARPIFLNEIQARNFHQDYFEDAVSTEWISCDEDWARFVAPCTGTFTIQTSKVNGWSPDANTRLVLFDGSLNPLAENDNISQTNLFSSITWNFINGQTYFILVENMSTGVTGYYNLDIDGTQVTGGSAFCSTQTFTLTQPSGVNVNWSILPTGIVNSTVISPNQIQLTQISGANGEITLTGNFVHPCDGRLKEFRRTIFVGLHTPIFDITPLGNGYCQNEWYEAIGSSIGNGTVSYNWRINGVLDNYHGYKIKRKFPANTTTISLTVVKPGCDESSPFAQTFVCGSARFSISPNPSGNNIKVKALGQATFSRVRIVDKMGGVKKDLQFPLGSKQADINISTLAVDIYSVQIFDGSTWSALLLSVQR